MNKQIIEVPDNIRFISEWPEFNTDLLKGHSIINKTITGCGFTHYCLTNSIPTILCSPRKFLLENKYEQHKGDTYLVINSGERSLDIDGEVMKERKTQSEDFDVISSIVDDIRNYVFYCNLSNKIPKILVTYDSLRYVLDALGNSISLYSIIVDEFQNIFMDASFKAETELNFVSELQSCPNVTYLSATPYIEEYLDELDEFKDLPYYEFDWGESRLRKIDILFKKVSLISREVDKILNNYLSGSFPSKYIDGIFYESKEVVFYMNSVRMIKNTIKRNNLTPDQVNVICADTPKNKKDLESIGHSIGKAPLKGEPHKMFTFCTRTTYVGADFYSTCAMSIIVSDCKIDSLSTDIRMDFPQIMGRQRLKENVFRDDCLFIYKLSDSEITEEEFKQISEEKLKRSQFDLENFAAMKSLCKKDGDKSRLSAPLQDYRDRISNYHYNKDYTGINEKLGEPVINKLVYLSEKRAFELRSNTYKTEVSVYNEFLDISGTVVLDNHNSKIQEELQILYQEILGPGSFAFKMEKVCRFLEKYRGWVSLSDIRGLSNNFRNYISLLGIERIRALGYKEAELKREVSILSSGSEIKKSFIDRIFVGKRYSLKELKDIIKSIYIDLNLTKTPKASDVLEIFEVKPIVIIDKETKKRIAGYEILSLKS
jgi:hypothetical protein